MLQWGAFPEVVTAEDDNTRKRLLRQYLTDIVLKDVVTRNEIRNQRAFDRVLTFYLTNPSSLHSYTALKNAFGVSTETAAAYTAALEDAFVTFEVPRYHRNLKVQTRDPKKVYVIDPGLRNVGARSAENDTGKLLENLVYLQLRRLEAEITYFRGKQEVDFVITESYQPVAAVQVCAADLENAETYRRETEALSECIHQLNLKPGTIVTWDREDRLHHGGLTIDLVPAHRWLRVGRQGNG